MFSEISFNTSLLLDAVDKHGNITTTNDFHLLSVNGTTVSNQKLIGAGGNVSSFGNFDYTVGGSSAADRAQPYDFVLQLTNHSQALASNFEVTNSSGNYFAAHMFTDLQVGGSAVTGFIGSDGKQNPNPVPVTSTLVMSSILLGMFGVVWSCMRRKRTVLAV